MIFLLIAIATMADVCDVSEKENWDVEKKKMTEMVTHRDGRIKELERRCSEQSGEVSQLVKRLYSHS